MRIKRVQSLLKEKKLHGLIVENPIDLFYLTSISMSMGNLLIEKDSATLFVDGRYFEACKRTASIEVRLLEKDSFLNFLQKKGKGKKIGFDSGYTSFARYESLAIKGMTLEPLNEPLLTLRAIKDESEIEKIAEAAALNAKGFKFAEKLLKVGVTEVEIARKLEIFYLENGGDKVSFNPIIAFGENSAEPHYKPSKTRALKKGEIVLIDAGVSIDYYNSDLTRVFFFGDANIKLKKIYEIVHSAVEAALKLCKHGAVIGTVEAAARDIIDDAGYGDFFPHGLGHGVGLQIHENPRIRKEKPWKTMKLEKGMVITIEPGIYIPKLGGVRLEEMILITDKGYKNLTPLALRKIKDAVKK